MGVLRGAGMLYLDFRSGWIFALPVEGHGVDDVVAVDLCRDGCACCVRFAILLIWHPWLFIPSIVGEGMIFFRSI